jgi:hypothetical protein
LARTWLAVGIDLVFVFVVVPALLLVPLIWGFAWIFYSTADDCPDPCDGPAMAATGVWFLVVFLIAVAYWPLLRWRGRRTVGQWVIAHWAWLSDAE